MKNLLLILCSIICINANAQLQTFYTSEGGLILDFEQYDGKDYLLYNNRYAPINTSNQKELSDNKGSVTLISIDEQGNSEQIATFDQAKSSTNNSRILINNGQLYFKIATNNDYKLNEKEYKVKGSFVNFFLFKVGDELSLTHHYYNMNCIVNPEIYTENGKTNFYFFMTESEIQSDINNAIKTTNTAKKYYGYSLNCELVDGEFKLIDDIAVDFKGNTDIEYQKYMFYKYSVGSGMLFSVTCNGMKFYRADKIIAETDTFDTRTSVLYPINSFFDVTVKPLIAQHNLGYSIYLNAFYRTENKTTFYLNPGSATTICFNGKCITNPNPNERMRLIIKDYNWLTGEGELIETPKNHNYTVQQIVKSEHGIYALAEYFNDPGYWTESALDVKDKGLRSLFVAKLNAVDQLNKPILIRGIDNPISLTQWFSGKTFNISDEGIALSGGFAIGIKVSTMKDSVIAQTGNDKFYLKIPFTQLSAPKLSERNFGIYPNPNSSQNNWVQIEIPSQDIEQLKVYNTKGQLLHSNPISQGSTNYLLNTSSLAKGLYIINLTSNKGIQYHQKLIRQ